VRVTGRGRGGGQMTEIDGLLEETGGGRGDGVAAGSRSGGGGLGSDSGVRRRSRRGGQYAVDGEQRRAATDGRRRLGHDDRGTGGGPGFGVAIVARLSRRRRRRRLAGAFVRGAGGVRPFRTVVAVVAQTGGGRAEYAAVSSVQFHCRPAVIDSTRRTRDRNGRCLAAGRDAWTDDRKSRRSPGRISGGLIQNVRGNRHRTAECRLYYIIRGGAYVYRRRRRRSGVAVETGRINDKRF